YRLAVCYAEFSFDYVFFFQAEDGIRDFHVTGVQTCALPIWEADRAGGEARMGRRVLDQRGLSRLGDHAEHALARAELRGRCFGSGAGARGAQELAALSVEEAQRSVVAGEDLERGVGRRLQRVVERALLGQEARQLQQHLEGFTLARHSRSEDSRMSARRR